MSQKELAWNLEQFLRTISVPVMELLLRLDIFFCKHIPCSLHHVHVPTKPYQIMEPIWRHLSQAALEEGSLGKPLYRNSLPFHLGCFCCLDSLVVPLGKAWRFPLGSKVLPVVTSAVFFSPFSSGNICLTNFLHFILLWRPVSHGTQAENYKYHYSFSYMAQINIHVPVLQVIFSLLVSSPYPPFPVPTRAASTKWLGLKNQSFLSGSRLAECSSQGLHPAGRAPHTETTASLSPASPRSKANSPSPCLCHLFVLFWTWFRWDSICIWGTSFP